MCQMSRGTKCRRSFIWSQNFLWLTSTVRIFQTTDKRRPLMSSTTPVSEMDVFLGRIGHLSKTKNLIGPEFEGQKKISVFGVVPISWLIFIGICCSFFNKDAARSVTFFDIILVASSPDKAFSDRNVTFREKLILGTGWERRGAEEGANWKKFVKSWPRHNLLTISLFHFFFFFFYNFSSSNTIWTNPR